MLKECSRTCVVFEKVDDLFTRDSDVCTTHSSWWTFQACHLRRYKISDKGTYLSHCTCLLLIISLVFKCESQVMKDYIVLYMYLLYFAVFYILLFFLLWISWKSVMLSQTFYHNEWICKFQNQVNMGSMPIYKVSVSAKLPLIPSYNWSLIYQPSVYHILFSNTIYSRTRFGLRTLSSSSLLTIFPSGPIKRPFW